MKNISIALIGLAVISAGLFYYLSSTDSEYNKTPVATSTVPDLTPTAPAATSSTSTTDPVVAEPAFETTSKIGYSVGKNEITAYHFGTGAKEVLLIGGIHGGYSWNTALLSYELIDWLKANPQAVPEDVKVTIIPVVNPDGLKLVTGSTGRFTASDVNKDLTLRTKGRFNENEVDLNRNFDCVWKEQGTWQNKTVSGGSAPFSEPEAEAIKDYVTGNSPAAIVTWYSSAGGVYASQCTGETLTKTKELTKLFADAAGYKAYEEFDYYEITGDMVNWFASEKIPAISVLLTDHEATEFTKNLAGLQAVISSVSE
jgi:Zinc carboxypeptidase